MHIGWTDGRFSESLLSAFGPPFSRHKNMPLYWYCLGLFVLLDGAQCKFHDGFTHHMVLDNDDAYKVYWKAENEKAFVMEVQVRTKGWVGLGLSPNGAMAGSDIVVMWMDDNAWPQISDRHGPMQTTNGFPPADAKQDYEMVKGTQNDTHSVFRFRRPFSTCDDDDWTITKNTARLIWAYGDEVPKTANDLRQHSKERRGVRSVHLLNPQTGNTIDQLISQPNVTTIGIPAKNVSIPHDYHTLYWCEIIQLPKFDTKRHVVGYGMRVEPGHEKYMHHILLYGCEKNMSRFLNRPHACFGDPEFAAMRECGVVLSAWGVGGDAVAYPDDLGAPYYAEEYDYVLAEFHYDNSDYDKDIVDKSIFELYVTDSLRKKETGRLTMGGMVNMLRLVIPPNTQSFTQYAFCPGQCTRNLQSQPITIFSGGLHTHLLGRKVRVRHVRNGVELNPILADESFDFNYQTVVVLDQPKTILPGDDLILECEYNSKGKDQPTFGGYGTPEEMCYGFFEYYPKREVSSEACYSALTAEKLTGTLGAKELVIDRENKGESMIVDEHGQNMTYLEWINALDWGANDVRKRYGVVENFQKFTKDQPHQVYCLIWPKNDTDPEVSPVDLQLKSNPLVVTPLDRTNPVCRSANTNKLISITIFAVWSSFVILL